MKKDEFDERLRNRYEDYLTYEVTYLDGTPVNIKDGLTDFGKEFVRSKYHACDIRKPGGVYEQALSWGKNTSWQAF